MSSIATTRPWRETSKSLLPKPNKPRRAKHLIKLWRNYAYLKVIRQFIVKVQSMYHPSHWQHTLDLELHQQNGKLYIHELQLDVLWNSLNNTMLNKTTSVIVIQLTSSYLCVNLPLLRELCSFSSTPFPLRCITWYGIKEVILHIQNLIAVPHFQELLK
jgi:hypothetical protein